MLSEFGTEIIGISAEVAIADVFGIALSGDYRQRGDSRVVEALCPIVENIFIEHNIPKPVRHIAEKQNPVDFVLAGDFSFVCKIEPASLRQSCSSKGWATNSRYILEIFFRFGG